MFPPEQNALNSPGLQTPKSPRGSGEVPRKNGGWGGSNLDL